MRIGSGDEVGCVFGFGRWWEVARGVCSGSTAGGFEARQCWSRERLLYEVDVFVESDHGYEQTIERASEVERTEDVNTSRWKWRAIADGVHQYLSTASRDVDLDGPTIDYGDRRIQHERPTKKPTLPNVVHLLERFLAHESEHDDVDSRKGA